MLVLSCFEKVFLQKLLNNMSFLSNFFPTLFNSLKRLWLTLIYQPMFLLLLNSVIHLTELVNKTFQLDVNECVKNIFADIEVFFRRKIKNNFNVFQVEILLVLLIRFTYYPESAIDVFQELFIQNVVQDLQIFFGRVCQ